MFSLKFFMGDLMTLKKIKSMAGELEIKSFDTMLKSNKMRLGILMAFKTL